MENLGSMGTSVGHETSHDAVTSVDDWEQFQKMMATGILKFVKLDIATLPQVGYPPVIKLDNGHLPFCRLVFHQNLHRERGCSLPRGWLPANGRVNDSYWQKLHYRPGTFTTHDHTKGLKYHGNSFGIIMLS